MTKLDVQIDRFEKESQERENKHLVTYSQYGST